MTEDSEEPEDDGMLHKQILKNIKDSRTHFDEWRDLAREDYAFYAGDQWDEDDAAILREQNRPAVVFNRIARTINGVAGLELQNRQEVRYFPRELRDGMVGELLSDAAKWARDNCDAEDEESEAFTDCLICGEGWTETRLDYETDPEGMIIIERRDPFSIIKDQTGRKRNYDDARYVGRIEEYSPAEFKRRFPDAELPSSRFFGDGDGDDDGQTTVVDPNHRYEGESGKDSDSKTIQVCQYQYYEVDSIHMVSDPASGQMVEMPMDRFKKLRPTLDAQGVQYGKEPRPKRTYYQVFLTATEILEKSPAPCNGFTFRAITGLRDRNENVWFGLVRLMKDPQRWANKWLSQIQHILNTQAKSGKLLYETGAVKDPKKFRAEWADPAKPGEMNSGAISQNKLMQIEAARYPEGMDRLLQYAINAVNDAPGVNVELLGLANRDQPGIVEENRKQAGITILAAFFDGLRRYRKEQGRILAKFIQDYISDGRLIRISGDIGPQAVPLVRDKMATSYDVIVDDAPTSTNMKERTFGVLSQLLPQLLQAQIPIPPEILDYAPLPEALTQKWKAFIQGQQNDPHKQQAQQMMQEAQAADTDGKKAKASLDMANARKALAEAQAGDGAQAEAQQRMAELQVNAGVEMEKAKLTAQIEREKMMLDAQLKREMAAVDMQVQAHKMDMDSQMQREKLSADTQVKREFKAIDVQDNAAAREHEAKIKAPAKPEQQAQPGQDMAGAIRELTKGMIAAQKENAALMTAAIKAASAPRTVTAHRGADGTLVGKSRAQ